jgi:hypothetical protein
MNKRPDRQQAWADHPGLPQWWADRQEAIAIACYLETAATERKNGHKDWLGREQDGQQYN